MLFGSRMVRKKMTEKYNEEMAKKENAEKEIETNVSERGQTD